jgi:hypothetical protein
MEEHLQQIRAAFEAGASEEARQAGIQACEGFAAVLRASTTTEVATSSTKEPTNAADAVATEPEQLPELCDPREVPPIAASATTPPPGTPSAATPSPETAATTAASGGGTDPAALAAVVAALRSLTPDQWLDLLIEKLRVAVSTRPAPVGTTLPSAPAATSPALPFAPASPQPLRFRFVSVPPARKR